MANDVFPLGFLPVGQDAVVKDIIGGIGVRRRLTDLGFAKGVSVRILKNDRGPLIVALGNSRVALGFGMAQKIIVKKI